MLKVTAHGLDELKAAFKNADAEIRKGIVAESKAWAPTLVQAAQAKARGPVEQKIAASGQVAVTSKGLVAKFGARGRIGKDPLAEVTRPYEFGTARPNEYGKYLSRHRLSHKAMRVTRRTQKQVPRIDSDGRFLYPALAVTTPKLVGRYVRMMTEAVT